MGRYGRGLFKRTTPAIKWKYWEKLKSATVKIVMAEITCISTARK
jgi:hypothetical protein